MMGSKFSSPRQFSTNLSFTYRQCSRGVLVSRWKLQTPQVTYTHRPAPSRMGTTIDTSSIIQVMLMELPGHTPEGRQVQIKPTARAP